MATGWTIRGSNPDWGKRFSLLPNLSDLVRNPHVLLFNRHMGKSGWKVNLLNHPHLVPSLRTNGAILLRSLCAVMPSTWTFYGKLHVVRIGVCENSWNLQVTVLDINSHIRGGNVIQERTPDIKTNKSGEH